MDQFVKKILLETNRFCNLNCAYCFYNDIGRGKNYLSYENIKEICKKYPLADEFLLTGGECTIHKEFYKIVDFLNQRGKVSVFTNGIIIGEKDDCEIEGLINKLDKIVVTYDSCSPSYNLRQGVELRILKSIRRIASVQAEKLEVKVCLSKFNISDFEETLKKLIENGVKKFSVNYVKNIKNSNLDFQISDDEVIKNFALINKYSKYFDMSDNRFIHESYKLNFQNEVDCSAGRTFIYIDCNGKEYYCPSSTKLFSIKSPQKHDCFGKHCICIWELFK